MALLAKSITDYIPSLWNMSSEEDDHDLPEFVEGDLVACIATDDAEVAGIIKRFLRIDGQDAVEIMSATGYGSNGFAYVTHLQSISITEYISIVEDTYGHFQQASDVQTMRRTVATRMQKFARWGSERSVSSMPQASEVVSLWQPQGA